MQRMHEQRGMLDIPDGATAGDVGRERGTRLRGRNALVGHDDHEAEVGRRIDATRNGRITGGDGDATKHARSNVIGVALDGRGAEDEAGIAQRAIAQQIGNRQRRDDCGSGRAAAGTERNLVFDRDREVVAALVKLCEQRRHDEIAGVLGQRRGTLTADVDGKRPRAALSPNAQPKRQRNCEAVIARAKVRGGPRHVDHHLGRSHSREPRGSTTDDCLVYRAGFTFCRRATRIGVVPWTEGTEEEIRWDRPSP